MAYLSTLGHNIAAAFNELTLERGDAPSDRLHRLE